MELLHNTVSLIKPWVKQVLSFLYYRIIDSSKRSKVQYELMRNLLNLLKTTISLYFISQLIIKAGT